MRLPLRLGFIAGPDEAVVQAGRSSAADLGVVRAAAASGTATGSADSELHRRFLHRNQVRAQSLGQAGDGQFREVGPIVVRPGGSVHISGCRITGSRFAQIGDSDPIRGSGPWPAHKLGLSKQCPLRARHTRGEREGTRACAGRVRCRDSFPSLPTTSLRRRPPHPPIAPQWAPPSPPLRGGEGA